MRCSGRDDLSARCMAYLSGLKDIIDTVDMPTENGTVLCAGRRPGRDASVVSRLRAAARDPRQDGEHRAGGGTTGQDASPARPRTHPRRLVEWLGRGRCRPHVPAGPWHPDQRLGDPPASFCGIVGFKPTHGLIGRTGVLMQSRTLDHVGVFARDIADVALLGDVLAGYDPCDPDTRAAAAPRLLDAVRQPASAPPRLAFVRSPVWSSTEEYTRDAFAGLVERLGGRVVELELPSPFDQAHDALKTIMEADQAYYYGPMWERDQDRISPALRAAIERGQRVTAVDWQRAVALASVLRQALQPLIASYDAILTPATTGEAPIGTESTGSPVFCTIWSLLGLPAITLPLIRGPNGLPIGVQLVAAGRRRPADTGCGLPQRRDGDMKDSARGLHAAIVAVARCFPPKPGP